MSLCFILDSSTENRMYEGLLNENYVHLIRLSQFVMEFILRGSSSTIRLGKEYKRRTCYGEQKGETDDTEQRKIEFKGLQANYTSQ